MVGLKNCAILAKCLFFQSLGMSDGFGDKTKEAGINRLIQSDAGTGVKDITQTF
jgi:hypothetical protein